MYIYDYGYKSRMRAMSGVPNTSTAFPADQNVFNLGGKIVKDDESRIPEVG